MSVARHICVAIFGVAGFGARAEPLEMPVSHQPCLPTKNLVVLDFSTPIPPLLTPDGSPALTALKSDYKVHTLFRYYDYPKDETLPGKTLRSKESDGLLAAGFKIGIVFQHHNDNPAKFFEPKIGKMDAEQALDLADENKQPYNTAIYFGIDGPEDHFKPLQDEYRLNNKGSMSADRRSELQATKAGRNMIKYYDLFYNYGPKALGTSDLESIRPAMMRPVIDEYFAEIETAFKAYAQGHGGKNYNIGIYCTAAMCKLGAKRGIKYVWLSPEGRFSPDYTELLGKPDIVNLVQWPETSCGDWTGAPAGYSVGFDFNQVNSEKSDLGA
jgi:hypothetical protein